jgi:hypothetical protein
MIINFDARLTDEEAAVWYHATCTMAQDLVDAINKIHVPPFVTLSVLQRHNILVLSKSMKIVFLFFLYRLEDPHKTWSKHAIVVSVTGPWVVRLF